MLYKRNNEEVLSDELFRNPENAYKGVPFWSWNCKITKELIDRQIDVYEEMGVGGFMIHPRTGLDTPYMGEEFLKLVDYCVEKAKKKGMLCYLYDEDRYASGAAGGMVTENVRFRQRFMLLSRKEQADLCQSRQEYEDEIDAGKKPKGYYLTSYRVVLDENGDLKYYSRISKEEAVSLSRDYEEEEIAEDGIERGKIWYAYVKLAKESPWFNDQTYIDVFNKEAVDRFIEVTHKRYYDKIGKDFGTFVPAIFTDEPQMAGKFAFATAQDNKDATLSFTDDMNETFKEAYGIELLDVVPEILWELPDGKISVHRYHYHDHLAERMAQGFPDNISKWCGERNLAMSGHYMSERTLYSQNLALGEAMRMYRNMQIPGIDILCDAKEFTTAKQAVSVARQNGREGVISEMYGSMHWDIDFKTMKLQGDWQAALGITIRTHHLTFMSMEGEAKRDWPASIGYQSPWYKKFSYLEDHFSRLNTALTRGLPSVSLGVVHPIESYWITYGPNEKTQTVRDQLDENYENLMQYLLYGMIDFDLISESLLPGQCKCPSQTDKLQVGAMNYDTILLPDLITIRSTTLERLEAFAANGGKVIFAGRIPKLVDAVPSDRAKKLAEKCVCVQFNRAEILDALQPSRLVEIRDGKGKLSTNLIYQMRQDKGGKWLFVCHVNRKNNLLDKREKYYIRVKGQWNPKLYNTFTGEIIPVKGVEEDGWTMIKQHIFAEDSVLLYLEPGEPKEVKEAAEPKLTGHRIDKPAGYNLDEDNVLLLDFAEYKLDDGQWQDKKEILAIDNEFRLALGLPRRQDHFVQPWTLGDVPADHTASLRFKFDSETAVSGCRLAMERPEKAKIFLNGKAVEAAVNGYYVDEFIKTVNLPEIKAGSNELVLEIPFGRKENLEWCYILGNFGVEVYGDYAHITARPEKLLFGDITRQGLPFYTGNLTYEMNFELPEDKEDVVLQVPHFASSVLEVSVDGENKGVIVFSPHKLSLGALGGGNHLLKIKMYGNRYNAFGTLHNANDEYKWYGPDSYRTSGTQWTDSYLVKPVGVLSKVQLLY